MTSGLFFFSVRGGFSQRLCNVFPPPPAVHFHFMVSVSPFLQYTELRIVKKKKKKNLSVPLLVENGVFSDAAA